ncbi:MAG: Co2+/Mg2+ efflux protein ApaG [bacterium]
MADNTASETLTSGVRVHVQPRFEPLHSEPERDRYVFSYSITITNESERRVQLLSRHWIIIDGNGYREDVRGSGVVGFTPWIPPGESFSYASYCPLATDFGTMEGTYAMMDETGNRFEVAVGRFYLVSRDDS